MTDIVSILREFLDRFYYENEGSRIRARHLRRHFRKYLQERRINVEVKKSQFRKWMEGFSNIKYDKETKCYLGIERDWRQRGVKVPPTLFIDRNDMPSINNRELTAELMEAYRKWNRREIERLSELKNRMKSDYGIVKGLIEILSKELEKMEYDYSRSRCVHILSAPNWRRILESGSVLPPPPPVLWQEPPPMVEETEGEEQAEDVRSETEGDLEEETDGEDSNISEIEGETDIEY